MLWFIIIMEKEEIDKHMQYIKEAIDLLHNIATLDKREIIGCSIEEIDILSDQYPIDVVLPDSYEEFLQYCGHGIADMMIGNDFFYNSVLFNCEHGILEQLYQQNNFFHSSFKKKFNINKETLLFYYRQGYFIYVFDMFSGVEDPEVYSYQAGSFLSTFSYTGITFSEYFLMKVQDYEKQCNALIANKSSILLQLFMRYKSLLLDTVDITEDSNNTSAQEQLIPLNRACNNAIRNIYTILYPYNSNNNLNLAHDYQIHIPTVHTLGDALSEKLRIHLNEINKVGRNIQKLL